MQIYGDDLERYILELIQEDFLNEARYACAIARGKFRIKKWGRNKIIHALKLQQVSAYCIKKAMKEIDEDEYLQAIEHHGLKKVAELKLEKNKFIKMTKIKNYLLQKGFEYEYINNFLKKEV
jgi:regulatory protein